ncbi:MAG: hypothetical protein GY906_39485 [bacterium]|nr:hypothetical protein [bacterium]
MNATQRWLFGITIVLCMPLAAVAEPDHHLEQTREIPLVDSQEDYERMSALMPRANEAIMQYITQSTQSIQQGYEMGFSSFRQWCREHEDALRSQTDDALLGSLLQAGLGTRPRGVSGRGSAFMQGLQQLLGSASVAGGSPAVGLSSFLQAHERAVERALTGLAGLPDEFRGAHLDVIEAARHQLLVELQSRQADPELAIELGSATIRVLRQAGVPTPGSETAHAFAQSVLERQVRLVSEEEGITIGGELTREVPTLLDSQTAAIESSDHGFVGSQNSCSLIRHARRTHQYLMHPPSPMGPCYRAAMARTLILIYNELDERLSTASLGSSGYPQLECPEFDSDERPEWDVDDPLGGDLSAVLPFSMLDAWTAIHSEESLRCPTGEATTTTRRRRGTGEAPTAVITWGVNRVGVDPGPPRGIPEVLVREEIWLDGSSSIDPSDGRLRFVWEVTDPGGSRVVTERTIGRFRGSRVLFRPQVDGAYAIQLTVTDRFGQTASIRDRISVVRSSSPSPDGRAPIPTWPDPSIDQLLRDLFLVAQDGTFARWFLRHHSTCLGSNPVRVRLPADTWRRPGQTGVSSVSTFRRPTSDHVRQLRQWRDSGTRITTDNEDEIGYFRLNHMSLQQTIDYWEAERRSERSDSRLSYRSREEYRNFATVMSFWPPRMQIPDGGVP